MTLVSNIPNKIAMREKKKRVELTLVYHLKQSKQSIIVCQELNPIPEDQTG